MCHPLHTKQLPFCDHVVHAGCALAGGSVRLYKGGSSGLPDQCVTDFRADNIKSPLCEKVDKVKITLLLLGSIHRPCALWVNVLSTEPTWYLKSYPYEECVISTKVYMSVLSFFFSGVYYWSFCQPHMYLGIHTWIFETKQIVKLLADCSIWISINNNAAFHIQKSFTWNLLAQLVEGLVCKHMVCGSIPFQCFIFLVCVV